MRDLITRSPLHRSGASRTTRICVEFTASTRGGDGLGRREDKEKEASAARRASGFPRGWQDKPSQVEPCRLVETQWGTDDRLRVRFGLGKTLAGRVLALRQTGEDERGASSDARA